MRVSKQILSAAVIIVSALSAGCHEQIPQQDAPGGVLSGNDYARMRAARNTSIDGNGYSTYKPTEAETAKVAAPAAAPVARPAAASDVPIAPAAVVPEAPAAPTPDAPATPAAPETPAAPATPMPAQ